MRCHFSGTTNEEWGLFWRMPLATQKSGNFSLQPNVDRKQSVSAKWTVVAVTVLPSRTLRSSGRCAMRSGKLRRDIKINQVPAHTVNTVVYSVYSMWRQIRRKSFRKHSFPWVLGKLSLINQIMPLNCFMILYNKPGAVIICSGLWSSSLIIYIIIFL